MDLKADLLERFLRYVQVDTQVMTAYAGQRCPTNPNELVLANMLTKELEAMHISYYHDEKGFVIAKLPGNQANRPSIAFLAHMDVAEDVPGTGVKPQVHQYVGGPIVLQPNVILDPSQEPELEKAIGDTIITSDGCTLLGADDKSGIAALMSMLKYFVQNPEIPHGDIEAVFTPDEEGGGGMQHFPLQNLQSKMAYTIDGGPLGEINYECYNAYTVHVHFTGVAIHAGSARGIMVNALSMLAAFVAQLPRSESPEATDGYYGCYWPDHAQGSIEKAELVVMIRDHKKTETERRIQALQAFATAVEAAFPGGKIEICSKLAYENMAESIQKNPDVLNRLLAAMQRLQIPARVIPIRGGTDGAILTAKGVPCPNIFTGGHNMHSVKEWLSLNTLEKACLLTIEIIKGA